jgi:hypothetical protein
LGIAIDGSAPLLRLSSALARRYLTPAKIRWTNGQERRSGGPGRAARALLAADPPQLVAMGFEYIWIIFFCGLATAIIGKAKGSSFWIWFLVGAVLPILGLIAVVLSRREKDEPERQCPTCLKPVKLYVQVCPRCGTDLYLPDPRAVRHPGVRG